jgi:hypothetical protein
LSNNGKSLDYVVTQLSFNEDNDNQSILFTPLRYINKAIYAVTSVVAAKPEVQKMVVMTPYQADVSGRPKLEAPAPAPKPVAKAIPVTEDDAVEEPKKRESKKTEAPAPTVKKSLDSVVAAWTDEE